MTHLHALRHRAGELTLALSALIAAPAWAVGDLAGGPAVNQIDLHPPVS